MSHTETSDRLLIAFDAIEANAEITYRIGRAVMELASARVTADGRNLVTKDDIKAAIPDILRAFITASD